MGNSLIVFGEKCISADAWSHLCYCFLLSHCLCKSVLAQGPFCARQSNTGGGTWRLYGFTQPCSYWVCRRCACTTTHGPNEPGLQTRGPITLLAPGLMPTTIRHWLHPQAYKHSIGSHWLPNFACDGCFKSNVHDLCKWYFIYRLKRRTTMQRVLHTGHILVDILFCFEEE